MLAFISGALVSGSINIFSTNTVSYYHYIIASTLLIASVCLVIWTIIVKPIEENYRSTVKSGDERKDIWMTELNRARKSKRALIILFLVSVICIVTSFILLVVFKIYKI